MLFLSSGIGLLVSNNVKTYGKLHYNDDRMLTLIASLANVANGGTRYIIYKKKS